MATNIILTMDGMLLNWLKNVGDSVNAGDIVAEVEADKATVEVEAPAAGVILSLDAQVGDELKEGTVIGAVGAAGEAPATASAPAATSAPAAAPAAVPASTGTAVIEVVTDGRVKVSPVARNIASERGINLNLVQGTGPGGRIVKADVENFQAPVAAAPAPQPVSSGISAATVRKLPEGPDVEILEITKMRARIGAGTTESKQHTPHFYVTNEVNLDALLKFRSQINSGIDEKGVKVSVNDMIVKASALALRQFPNLNTHHYGEKLVLHKRINVSTAVALAEGGVIYVVAKDADKLSLSEIAILNKGLVSRAREGKIKPEDIRDGTFSVSNLGPFDVDNFIAIINPPESAVLAVGSGIKQPVVLPDGTIGIQTRMKATVSADHRVTDGAEVAQFLQAFKALIENPMRLV